jgi:5-methylcytosine-specific restriction protein A
MSIKSHLAPVEHHRVIDLVQEAGIDVSDWANCSGGAARAAVNPKYCYQWAFSDPGRLVVLNLWYGDLDEADGTLIERSNLWETEKKFRGVRGKEALIGRARGMDRAIRTAFEQGLRVRVVVCDGTRRDEQDARSSKVTRRLLDPVEWHVQDYDYETGNTTLVRGVGPVRFVDQFAVDDAEPEVPARRNATVSVFDRSAEVRRLALRRAGGKCELCHSPGFKMPGNRVYLETHHIDALADGGFDTPANVVALCPNHHREAHYGIERDVMRTKLRAIVVNAALQ